MNGVHAVAGDVSAIDAGAVPVVPRRHGVFGRIRLALAALGAGILGVAPHVLHHVGPLAGAALFAGVAGTLLFGVIGLVLAIPTLLAIHHRTGGWRVPAAALALMATVFSLSAFVIGPAITGAGDAGDKGAPAQSAPGDGRQQAPAEGDDGHLGHHP